ncbi:stage V sporulation protein B [Paenibacillus sp. MBLB4367]|uniref:stage V sporulation protein B n=1 Tax=Paenibacillus sp. MBLB4367 TaxID=3384767 RepID=UPI00390810FB
MSHLKQSFITGTVILLLAGVVNRILGFVPRIALPRVIGPEGVGIYQLGYPFLIFIITIITGGIPLAVAKLVAEADSEGDEARVRRIFKLSLTLSAGLGLFFTIISMLSARFITSHLMTDPRVYYTFLCMSPIILLVSVSAVIRGYFQGRQNMIPTASSQVSETVVRIFGMLLFAYWLLPYGIEFAAAGAMIGVTVGELCGMAVILLHYYFSRNAYKAKSGQQTPSAPKTPGFSQESLMKRLFRIALPVTASRLVGSTSYLLESIFIAQSLAVAGIAAAVATAQYGTLQGMIIPVLLLPSALTYSLSVSLIPSLSEAAAHNDLKTIHKRMHQSIRLALVTGAPFAVMMYVLADPVCYYLYKNTEIGSMLRMMAPIALFIYVQAPLQAALQALDKPGTALVNTFIGSAVKLLLITLLASKPNLGILGAVIAININIIIVTMLHWNSVSRLLKLSLPTSDFTKLGAAMLVMGLTCYGVMNADWTDNAGLRFGISAGLGGVVYLLCMAWFKLVDIYDLRRIPWIGKKL